MSAPSPPPEKEQRLLRNARKEGLVIMTLWALCLFWSVGSAYLMGYNVTGPVPLILGMPGWVFWSVLLPWGICLLFSTWFCFCFMAIDDLGEDPAAEDGHV
jgi:hypothetical protein